MRRSTHGGRQAAIGDGRRECCAAFERTLRKRAVAVVVIQIVLHAAVRNENIGVAVAVVISEGHAQRAPFFCRYPRAYADVFKGPVPSIVIKNARRGRKLRWGTVSVPIAAADLAMLRVPFH